MKISQSRILVTGACGGIGIALCRQLASAGATLVMTGRDESRLRSLLAELDGLHSILVADISTEDGRHSLAEFCNTAEVNGVINVAGTMDFGMFIDQSNRQIEQMLQVNLLATVLLTRALLPQLLGKPEARIINVGSIFGSIGHPGFAVYCASKAAVRMFSEAMSRELADTSVSVGYLAPRATRTAFNPDRVVALNKALGNKADSPELVATAIIKLYENKARQRFMGWPEQLFVKLNALLPSVVHQALVKKLALVKQYAQP